ncbi:Ribosome-associated, YjgA [Burkholderiaceae bacterium]
MNHVDAIDPDEDLGPSKSELKRQMSERQKLAETLAKFSPESLKTVPLEDSLRATLLETAKIKSFEGIRRHKQYLGKLMRSLTDDEIAAIRKQIDVIEGPGRVETANLHRLERLRERLLSHEEALTELISQHPNIDVQNLRTLIRNARKEKELNKSPKAYREIFQVLRELLSPQS